MKPDVKPEDLYHALTQNPNLKENSLGEPFAWHATNSGDLFVTAYEVWKDTTWLDWAIKYYDFLRSRMQAGPDGYIGLIGPNFRHKELWSNEEISDALAANLMLEFCELVMNDAKLRKVYKKPAEEYIGFCKKHMIEKWDKRHLWHEIGDYGDYIFGCDFVQPNDFSQWVMDEKNLGSPWMSQKYNIANDLGVTNLRLYRITGEKFYRDKAEKLFFRMKSNFQFFNNHYVWNYWNPFYEKDIVFDKNTCIHWTAVHPYRPGYQAAEVSQIVEAYHTGVVFDSIDIERIINTNLDVMWNKSMEHPEYIISTGEKPDTTDKNEEGAVAGRGTLWASLGDFSQTIRDLGHRPHRSPGEDHGNRAVLGKIRQAYYDSIVAKTPPSFKRKYAEGRPVIVKDVPLGNSPDLNYVSVIPYIIKRGQNSFVVTKSIISGNLTIELYTSDGKTRLRTIYQGTIIGDGDGLRGFHMLKWDGMDPDKKETFKGDYLVRWTLNGKYRDYAITIQDRP